MDGRRRVDHVSRQSDLWSRDHDERVDPRRAIHDSRCHHRRRVERPTLDSGFTSGCHLGSRCILPRGGGCRHPVHLEGDPDLSLVSRWEDYRDRRTTSVETYLACEPAKVCCWPRLGVGEQVIPWMSIPQPESLLTQQRRRSLRSSGRARMDPPQVAAEPMQWMARTRLPTLSPRR